MGWTRPHPGSQARVYLSAGVPYLPQLMPALGAPYVPGTQHSRAQYHLSTQPTPSCLQVRPSNTSRPPATIRARQACAALQPVQLLLYTAAFNRQAANILPECRCFLPAPAHGCSRWPDRARCATQRSWPSIQLNEQRAQAMRRTCTQRRQRPPRASLPRSEPPVRAAALARLRTRRRSHARLDWTCLLLLEQHLPKLQQQLLQDIHNETPFQLPCHAWACSCSRSCCTDT